MGLSFSKLLDSLFGKYEIRITMIGLDAAGKTAILYKLKNDEIVTTTPTIGFNAETVEYKNISFNVWDLGGQDKIRSLWKKYFEYNHCIIYVVDSNDRDRIQEACNELHHMLKDNKPQDALLLVFANKQDLPNVMSVEEITDKLNLQSITQKWHIQATSAKTGEGLYDGLEWFSQNIADLNFFKVSEKKDSSKSNKDKDENNTKIGFSISNFLSSLWNGTEKKEIKIFMIGLDAVGKTKILYKLKLGELVETIPNQGHCNVETIEFSNCNYEIWEYGSADKGRVFWRHYYQNKDAIIFVVDCNDRDRIQEARDELHRMLNDEVLRDVITLVYANKQDLRNVMSVAEVTDKLELRSIKQDCYVQACSCYTGEGLYEGLYWIKQKLIELKKI